MHIVTFSALADFPALLEAHIRAFPADSLAEDNIVLQRLRYILGFEIHAFHNALHAMLTEERSSLNLVYEADENADSSGGIDSLLTEFHTARQRSLSILDGLDAAQWSRSGQYKNGDVTVIGLVHLLSAHDWRQLSVLQQIMATQDVF